MLFLLFYFIALFVHVLFSGPCCFCLCSFLCHVLFSGVQSWLPTKDPGEKGSPSRSAPGQRHAPLLLERQIQEAGVVRGVHLRGSGTARRRRPRTHGMLEAKEGNEPWLRDPLRHRSETRMSDSIPCFFTSKQRVSTMVSKCRRSSSIHSSKTRLPNAGSEGNSVVLEGKDHIGNIGLPPDRQCTVCYILNENMANAPTKRGTSLTSKRPLLGFLRIKNKGKQDPQISKL